MMERSNRARYIPTTEHGLPLDINEASPQVNFAAYDQPVYRSISLATPINSLESSQKFSIDTPAMTVRDDLALEKVRFLKSRSNSIEGYSFASVADKTNPLRMDDSLVLQRTKFKVTSDYDAVRDNLIDYMHSEHVNFNDVHGPTFHCSQYSNGDRVNFDVNVYDADDSSLVVEFQRKSGCPMLFNRLFRASHRWFNLDDQGKELLSPKQLAAMLQSKLSSSLRNLGLQTLRRWMREDPDEATAAFASLVSSGFLTGSDVVDLAVEILDISPLHALCSLSHLARSDTVAVASHWDALRRPLMAAISGGDAHTLTEACELCSQMHIHSRNHPELVNTKFLDEEVISAARSRLARESSQAPVSLTVALRTMMQALERH